MLWWKIYFWVYTIIIALGIIGIFSLFSTLLIADWVSIILNFLFYLGLYAYVFKKKTFWKQNGGQLFFGQT